MEQGWRGSVVSHHFDTPTAREDPRLNLSDMYLFAGSAESTVMAMTVNPAATPDTMAPFRDEAIYAFHVDTGLDGREDVSFTVGFTDVPAGGRDEPTAHVQAFEVRRVVHAGIGSSAAVMMSGATGQCCDDDGVRAFAGVVHDAFAGDAAALNAFKDAFSQGDYRPDSFGNRVNSFHDRTIAAIVLEVPNGLISATPHVQVWATVSLQGHAPDQQVARWGLPLFTHIFLRDDDLREQFNRSTPAQDDAVFVSSTIDTVTRYVTAAGTAADPGAYARRVAERFESLSLPYELGSTASFDFAGFNGRALSDNVMDVMLTLLVNAPLGTGIHPDPARFTSEFPHLRPAPGDGGV
jgi:hypothetical protein